MRRGLVDGKCDINFRSTPRSRPPPRKKSWSRYLTPNIFPSSFDIRRYYLCKLNICVPRLFSSSSVTKGFPCWNGVRMGATGISASTCSVASSSVNTVLERNIAACRSAWSCTSVGCRSGNPGTLRGSSPFCCVPNWGMVLPHFFFRFLTLCAFVRVRS